MDCEFSSLVVIEGHSRVPLSPSDRSTVTQYLYRAEEEIRKCEYEMKKLVTKILSLENGRRGLQKSVDLYRSVLSPVQRMPTEMLSSIFAFCCEKNELSSPRRLPVMSLSMVCARWRDIVLSTPWLWSKLDVDFEPSYALPSRNKILSMAQITQLFMQRSQNAPLTWSLDYYHIAPILPVLRPLLQNSERWRSISLYVDESLIDEPAFTSISGRIPMLERLKLYTGDDIRHGQLDMFAVAPALSMVDCTPMYLHNMALPWSQIRNLTLRYSYTPESLFVLSQCPNLEELKLDRIGSELFTERNFEIVAPVTLHKVHTLSIICDAALDGDDFVFAFEFLTLPSLSFIALSSDIGNGWEGISWGERREEIQRFLLRSQCNITSLRMEAPGVDDHQAISFLLFLPSLEALYLQDQEQEYYYDDDDDSQNRYGRNKVVTPLFLQQLIIRDGHSSGSSHFLPRLSNLTLVVHSDGLDVESLCDAVISRWNTDTDTGVCSLQSVVIEVAGDGACLEKLLALEKLGTAGRRITVSHVEPHVD
ncbi:hypothetical protein Moror_14798 [Moniliophthora roreri MCA 2997]|uniref:Uncharacterized protein n=1 Tax=Moniliophthora roreri (strain MCA 2997) TaxID=1381753 RepID=V2X7A5_MONRO|nr:hypothetical protein Moror_14798 [Moniliophthora roreri MCA 2997]